MRPSAVAAAPGVREKGRVMVRHRPVVADNRDHREDLDYDANPNINPATIHTLARCEWVRKGEPLCLIGDSGTGKTHLLIGLGTAAAQAPFDSLTHQTPSPFSP